ncbi:hypothetical protein BDP55DRAFT_650549 [Colletotrichum godetiae]|uniref:Uncharacterized protein n=1 Tax=Colletotrichum godetiae TaxID=1209918 RepID=A0AAJ0AU37_9PEZI|nr:uncharacterized protein BDP55DRAFT_650549 [Colletotrichum godetiae]KAK1690396.1 hypothetical protein BDP55DRAFT_650549 [Colletotrichum godetiae]
MFPRQKSSSVTSTFQLIRPETRFIYPSLMSRLLTDQTSVSPVQPPSLCFTTWTAALLYIYQ